jgi:hypothetical protein
VNHVVKWIDRYREPTQPPNTRYPTGVDVDLSSDAERTCHLKLTYPAPRIGVYSIRCLTCGLTVAITTAGRADDPRSVKLACKLKGEDSV